MASGVAAGGGTSVLDHDGNVQAVLACRACGESLTRRRADEACARCSEPISATLAERWTRIDRAGRVVFDEPCGGCGYNLRTQPLMGDCPECATPVRETLLSSQLEDYDFDWLRTIVGGSRLIVIGVVVMILLALGMGVGAAAAGAAGANPSTIATASTIGTYLTMVLIAVGIYRLTTFNPALHGAESARSARRLTRVLLLGWAILFVVGQALQLLAVNIQLYESDAGVALAMIVGVLGTLAWIAMIWTVLLVVRRYLRLVPAPGMARFASVMIYSTVVMLILMPISAIASTIMMANALAGGGAGPGGAPAGNAALMAGAATTLGCVGGLWGLAMLVFVGRAHLALSKSLKRARGHRQPASA